MWKSVIKLVVSVVAFVGILYVVKEIGFQIGMRL